MLKAYKFRLYPTHPQVEQFIQHFGAVRFVYNWSLEQKIKIYKIENKSLSRFELNKMLPTIKNDNEWLKSVNAQSLQEANIDLDSAFTKFFREKKGFPKFKSKKNIVQSFHVPQHYTVDFENNTVKLPKIGSVKAIIHRTFEGKLKTATVSMNSVGQFYISILVNDGKELPNKQSFDESTTVGVDVGIKDFAIQSDGTKIENPKYLRNSSKKLSVLQRRLSRKQKGSNNRNKARKVVAKQYLKISNQRKDFLHKLTFNLIRENQAIAVETLNVKCMLKNHCLAKAISDVSWSEFFRQLEYKAEWYGKTVLKIGRFEPSTKICSKCGYYNHTMTLSVREWECPKCNATHDRDINAANNIKTFALQKQNLFTVGTTG